MKILFNFVDELSVENERETDARKPTAFGFSHDQQLNNYEPLKKLNSFMIYGFEYDMDSVGVSIIGS